MRIAFEYMLPGCHDTGVEVAIRELLSALVKLRSDDEFMVYTNRRASRTIPKDPNISRNVSRLASIGRPFRIAWQQLVAPTVLRNHRPDIYHATGYVASPFLGLPTVVSVYDTIALDHPELTRWQNAAHYRLGVRAGLRTAERVIVPSAHVKNRLVTLTGMHQEKVTVIPLGVGQRFKPLSETETARCLAPIPALEGRKYILFVGNLERKKNLSMLLSAFAGLQESSRDSLKLVLAGKPGNDARVLGKAAHEAGIADDVVFTGYMDDDVLPALYCGAQLFVYPSLEEGFGLPPLEAMACGTPVVAADSAALPETTGGAAVLVDPMDSEALSHAISSVLNNSARCEELRKDGLKHAKTFTWEVCAKRVMDVYREVVAERSSVVTSRRAAP